jgi:Pectate lyase superfamily protein
MRLQLSGRVAVLFAILAWTIPANQVLADTQRYPLHENVVDVTAAPYQLKPDGVTDVTDGLQRALDDHVGRHHVLYFPKGVYLVSRTLNWPKKVGQRDNWGFTMLRGEDRDETVLRLKPGTFTDPNASGAIMWCGGFGSADWFHNHIENLTFDVGDNNAGACGLQFYSNNTGAVRDCRFIAGTNSGNVGLELGHRDMNGPLLVKNCEVVGFRTGIASALAVNSQTFEHISLSGQREVGFSNAGQSISIRGLTSDNSVPAVGTYGRLLLIDAVLTGTGNAQNCPGIVNYNGGRVFLRDVTTTGYCRALADMQTPDFAAAYRIEGEDKPGSLGPNITEYSSHPASSLFGGPPESLRLPVKEVPASPWHDLADWAIVDQFGADPTGNQDSTAAIQKAVDSGARTIFFPGHYRTSKTIVIRKKVERIIGISGWMNYGKSDRPDFRIENGSPETVFIENFSSLSGGIEIATKRTVVIKSVGAHTIKSKPATVGGEIFLEDVVTNDLQFNRQSVWGRQLNIENEGTHLTNRDSQVWILGYKTERGGTLVHTLGKGQTELLGGFSYTTTAGKLAPMFVNEGADMWAFFGEICFNGDPYTTLVKETRDKVTKTLLPADGQTMPYSGRSKR